MAYILENVLCGFNVRNTETNQYMDFQHDWDYPRLASMFGNHNIICDCGETDGTVDCPHKTAHDMITEASEWLFDNDGVEADGRGTFDDYPEECWHDEWIHDYPEECWHDEWIHDNTGIENEREIS